MSGLSTHSRVLNVRIYDNSKTVVNIKLKERNKLNYEPFLKKR